MRRISRRRIINLATVIGVLGGLGQLATTQMVRQEGSSFDAERWLLATAKRH